MPDAAHVSWWREVGHLFLLIIGLPLTVLAGGMGVAMLVEARGPSDYAPLLANTSVLGFPAIAGALVIASQLLAPGLRLDAASAPDAYRAWQSVAGLTLLISAVSTSWVVSAFSGTGINSERQANGLVFGEVLVDCWPLLLSAAAMIICGVLFRLSLVSRIVPVALFVAAVTIQRGLW